MSSVGALLIEKFGLDGKEITGVFRAGINPIKQSGFMKIHMNGPIDVNQRFGHCGGVAEDDRVTNKCPYKATARYVSSLLSSSSRIETVLLSRKDLSFGIVVKDL